MSMTLARAEEVTASPEVPTTTSTHATIYRVAGYSAAIAALLTPISVGVFMAAPPPAYDEGARAWFEHLQEEPFLGLMSLDLPFLLISALMIPVMLALVLALRHVRPAHVLLAATFYLVAVATYFGTNTTIEMITLSDRYAQATTEAQQITLLGGGEALLAAFSGTAFHVNYIFGQVAGIILGLVMLRSELFSRKIAYLMIGGNAFGFLLYAPRYGVELSAVSGLILWAWMILIARRLLQLARE